MAEVVEGWYPDPELSGIDRWWDGQAWTSQRRNTPEDVKTARDTLPPAGWYRHAELQGVDQYWDGVAWTEQFRNTPPT